LRDIAWRDVERARWRWRDAIGEIRATEPLGVEDDAPLRGGGDSDEGRPRMMMRFGDDPMKPAPPHRQLMNGKLRFGRGDLADHGLVNEGTMVLRDRSSAHGLRGWRKRIRPAGHVLRIGDNAR